MIWKLEILFGILEKRSGDDPYKVKAYIYRKGYKSSNVSIAKDELE